ncbi:hypothetical protein RJT34_02856 [Clitoria ternatea]|uniref:Ribosomal protein S16 n=1 Tax=Clitoria ternatea TaxID=43366 RepID=A0AAN9KL45_CLITE
MVVRIRLSRLGCKNNPFYRVMAADSRSPRDGKHLEVLGYDNPLPGQDGGKRMGLNFDRVKYWLSVGAQPSEPVERILFRAGLLPPLPMLSQSLYALEVTGWDPSSTKRVTNLIEFNEDIYMI